MWFNTLFARNAAISKPSNITEEDQTYEALMRIPRKAMDERFGEHEYSLVFERLYNLDWAIKANRVEARKQIWLVPLSYMGFRNCDKLFFHARPAMEGLDPIVFEGTGWTVQSYVAEVQKEVDEVLAEAHEKKKLYFKKLALYTLLVANVTPWVSFFFGPLPLVAMIGMPVTIGIAGGIIMAKILK